MSLVSPLEALKLVANAIPDDCKENLIIIGSLAAAAAYFIEDEAIAIRTKDADCLLSPRLKAIHAGKGVVERLFDNGWHFHGTREFPIMGTAATPDHELPVARLRPPDSTEWFIELLTVPGDSREIDRQMVRLDTSRGVVALCSFGYLALTDYKPIRTQCGIYVARPEMMALANMLHHPDIGDDTMAGLIEGRQIKRSNKDLGRVLAIAYLAERREEDALRQWAGLWADALQNRFAANWRELAMRAGDGIRLLLADHRSEDLREAHHTCTYGILNSLNVTQQHLEIAGRRLLVDAIEPLFRLAYR